MSRKPRVVIRPSRAPLRSISGVGDQRRAVHDLADVGERRCRPACSSSARPSSAPTDGSCGVVRHLCRRMSVRSRVEQDEVGEGAADVEADAIASCGPRSRSRRPSSSRIVPHQRCRSVACRAIGRKTSPGRGEAPRAHATISSRCGAVYSGHGGIRGLAHAGLRDEARRRPDQRRTRPARGRGRPGRRPPIRGIWEEPRSTSSPASPFPPPSPLWDLPNVLVTPAQHEHRTRREQASWSIFSATTFAAIWPARPPGRLRPRARILTAGRRHPPGPHSTSDPRSNSPSSQTVELPGAKSLEDDNPRCRRGRSQRATIPFGSKEFLRTYPSSPPHLPRPVPGHWFRSRGHFGRCESSSPPFQFEARRIRHPGCIPRAARPIGAGSGRFGSVPPASQGRGYRPCPPPFPFPFLSSFHSRPSAHSRPQSSRQRGGRLRSHCFQWPGGTW